ncbi:MAG TPA: twin-arginine translocation signal domain-containing protein, partial [Vicinamibacterales bacterium]|nr:twin-arginine translocation signal domain-containing protein [Vicinamibacterales bacterium]
MSSESDETRRDFLKTAATAGAAGVLSGLTFLTRPGRVFGANDRVRVAVCGLRGRGKDHLNAFSRLPNVEIAA